MTVQAPLSECHAVIDGDTITYSQDQPPGRRDSVARLSRGLGWDPGGLDVLRAVGWDPREHPRVLHGEHGGQFARKPGAGLAAGLTGEKYPGQFSERIRKEWRFAEDPAVKQELNLASADYDAENYPGAARHLREAARLARVSTSHNTDPHALMELAADVLVGWGGDRSRSQEIKAYAALGRIPQRVKSQLDLAAERYDAGDWQNAVTHLHQAAWRANTAGDMDLVGRLRSTVHDLMATHDDVDWLGQFPDELGLERVLASGQARAEIDRAAGQYAATHTDWDEVAKALRGAGRLRGLDGDAEAETRLVDMAERVQAKYGKSAKLTASVRAFVAKGADKVPGLLGGGVETWDRKLSVVPELPSRSLLGTTLAEMNWSGHMTMIEAVAKGISTDLHMTGEPVASMDSFTVPLHELIHNSIGGRWEAQVKAHAESGRTEADDVMLARFASLDFARADGGPKMGGIPGVYTPSEINGHEWVNAVQEAATLREAKAQIEDLVKRGFLEWSGTSSSVGGGPYERQYRRTAKAIATDPPRASDAPQPDEGKWPYQQQEVQAIEEGFTELGTIQHAAEYFNATGIGGRETPIHAISHKPDPVAKAKLARDLEGHAGEVPGEAHLWMEAARKLRRDDQFGAQRELSKIWDLRVGDKERSRQVMMLKADINGLYLSHTVDNPAYVKRRAALIAGLQEAEAKIHQRLTAPEMGQVADRGALEQARGALVRAVGDLDHHAPPGDVLEELARVQHLGDRELADVAKRLRADYEKLTATPQEKRATMAEYARRVNDRDRIVNGDAWGHYGEWTKQALLWCEAVAMAEGLKGRKLTARVRELADEINRESAAKKTDVMAAQALRAFGRAQGPGVTAQAVIEHDWLEFGALVTLEHVKDRVAA